MPAKPLQFADVRRIALALPGVTEGTLHGEPSLKCKGKLLACPAMHRSAQPDALAVRISLEKRDALIAAEPEIYYVTDHYLDHPMILVRLSRMTRPALKVLIRTAWEEATAIVSKSGRQRSQGNRI